MLFPFLFFKIVNNKFCAIDVDKWDYIVRDAYYLKHAIDLPHEFVKVFEGNKLYTIIGKDEKKEYKTRYRYDDNK